MKKLIFLFILIAVTISIGQEKPAQAAKSKFIYILKLTPKYYDDKNWTADDMKTVQEHFARLQQMQKDGSLFLAGRTDVENSKTTGIVIYESESFEKAKEIAESDPAVKAGIMSVETFPFNLALMKGMN